MCTLDNMNSTQQYNTKSEAVAAANQMRAEGHTVKVYQHRGTYTQPGVGITAYRYYTVN